MCDIVFKKVQGRAWNVGRTSPYAEAAVRRILLKWFYENIRRIRKRNHLCRNLFFDKIKLCRSATSLKSNL